MSTEMIELKNLQKVIGGNTVVDIPELIVQEGKITALVGSAGTGKETIFEILSGQALPTVGTARIAGIDPARGPGGLSYRVGVLFSEDALYKNLSPLANLEFQCRLYGLPRSRAEEVLAEVGLVDQAGSRSDKLPSGLQRRLAVGRAILHNPKALLLFEPFIRCDETTIDLLSNIFLQKAASGTALLIFATDTTNLEPLCDSIYPLNQGRLLESYRPKEERQEHMPFKIPVRLEDKVVLFNPADILYADAGEGRANIVTLNMRLPTQFTLSELEQRLGRSGFFRAHRSYLVNLQHVKEVIPYTRNSFTLRLDDAQNTEIPLSKSSAGELKELLGY
jgi:ABC-2 type transport system ATP-binding protein